MTNSLEAMRFVFRPCNERRHGACIGRWGLGDVEYAVCTCPCHNEMPQGESMTTKPTAAELLAAITALEAAIAARPYGGETLAQDYRHLAELERARAELAEAELLHLKAELAAERSAR